MTEDSQYHTTLRNAYQGLVMFNLWIPPDTDTAWATFKQQVDAEFEDSGRFKPSNPALTPADVST